MQKDRWNKVAGCAWVDSQAIIEGTLEGLVAPLLDGLSGTVLDVGCGTGATTVAAAQRGSKPTGVDISEPMLAVARERAPEIPFIVADAQTYAFEPDRFDHVISRFGVMFFDDPVAAFGNLRRAGRHLRLIVWRTAEENPFMTAAEHAARPLLPDLPERDPHQPGQFAFGDKAKVERLLSEAGWSEIALEPLDVECAMPAAALEGYVSRLGPVGMALQDADADTRERVIETVLPAFAAFVQAERVCFNAACWIVTARRL